MRWGKLAKSEGIWNAECRLLSVDCRVSIAECRLPSIADFRVDCRVSIADFRLSLWDVIKRHPQLDWGSTGLAIDGPVVFATATKQVLLSLGRVDG